MSIMYQGAHFDSITDPRVIADLIAGDVLAEDNCGVIGYDHSPEVEAQVRDIQQKLEAQFWASH